MMMGVPAASTMNGRYKFPTEQFAVANGGVHRVDAVIIDRALEHVREIVPVARRV
jgi:hypothetical protein